MTEPASSNEVAPQGIEQEEDPSPPPFAPLYTLVNNISTRTTHHPHVHYIFSDDDPDLLTQALAQQHAANVHDSGSEAALDSRAVLLDLTRDSDGGYNVSWASSLSPSWAVLDAQLSQISPPSSDGESGSPHEDGNRKKPERLMLRIEGVDGYRVGAEGDLRLSSEGSRQGSASGSGSGSGHPKDRVEGEDYTALVEEFEKRMSMLKKAVNSGEERRLKVGNESEEHAHTGSKVAEAATGD